MRAEHEEPDRHGEPFAGERPFGCGRFSPAQRHPAGSTLGCERLFAYAGRVIRVRGVPISDDDARELVRRLGSDYLLASGGACLPLPIVDGAPARNRGEPIP